MSILIPLLVFIVILSAVGNRSKRREPSVPTTLPVQAKQYFFSRSERAFYSLLLHALEGTSYRVFPNVRLQDLFLIKARGAEWGATRSRLRDKHVDFLLVQLPDYQPVLGIELDGQSHDAPEQQYRDVVKDVVFRSGGLKLLRLSTREQHTVSSIRAHLEVSLGNLEQRRHRPVN